MGGRMQCTVSTISRSVHRTNTGTKKTQNEYSSGDGGSKPASMPPSPSKTASTVKLGTLLPMGDRVQCTVSPISRSVHGTNTDAQKKKKTAPKTHVMSVNEKKGT